ncbi:MAG: efflux RND transporter periplasmic adaptor subunit, partial [Verrucomicrobiota bacterium]|nr:efflux RND transporter periplasmic adaptor subunit [Verrucomicrobiota bacterium]
PGMTANVSIVAAHRDDALKIPNAALRFRMPGATPPPRASGSPGSGAGGGGQGEHHASRTVYVLSSPGAEPKAVSIKTGISDGVSTELLEGLKEGDVVVTGTVQASAAARPSTNPFGGGGRRGP